MTSEERRSAIKAIKERCSMLDDVRLEEVREFVKKKWFDWNEEMTFERVGYRIPLSPAKTKDE